MHYFVNFFFLEIDITCIISVVGAQQQHKGMFLKHGVGGGPKFSNSVMGEAIFFPCIRERGAIFFPLSILPKPSSPPPPLQP